MAYPANLTTLTATHKVVSASGRALKGNVYAVPGERVWATDGSIVEYEAKASIAADGSYELVLPHIDQASIRNKGVPWKITEDVPGQPRSFWVAPMVAMGTGTVDVATMLTSAPASKQTVIHAGPVTDQAAADLLNIPGGQFAASLSTTIATEVPAPARQAAMEYLSEDPTVVDAAATRAVSVGADPAIAGALTNPATQSGAVIAGLAQIAPAPTGGNDAPTLNAALASGALVVDGRGRSYSIASSLTVPTGVTLLDCRLNLTTPGINGVLVHDRAKVSKVSIYGTGTTNITERGIYPASIGASDVELDVTVENMTIGVHARPLGDSFSPAIPQRWTGSVRARNIVGANGASEGYGLLLSDARHCRFEFDSHNVKRHSIYLSAGASHNTIRGTTSRNDHAPVQIASYADQAPCLYNTIDITCDDVANTTLAISTFGVNLVGKVSGNTVNLTISDSPQADGAVLFRSLGADAVCRDNTVTARVFGTFINDVIKSDAALENVVYLSGVCATADPGTWGLVGVRSYNNITHTVTDFRYALRIGSINVNALGTATRAVINSQSAGLVDLGGKMNVHATTANPLVSDFTGKVTGFAFEETLQVTTPVIAAGASGVATFTFENSYQTQRVASITATQSGVTGVANAATLALQGLTATGATVAVKNNTTTDGTVTVRLRVAGY